MSLLLTSHKVLEVIISQGACAHSFPLLYMGASNYMVEQCTCNVLCTALSPLCSVTYASAYREINSTFKLAEIDRVIEFEATDFEYF